MTYRTVEGGELSDIDLRHGFNISFRVGIPMEDGAIYSLEKEMFKVFAPQFGLDPPWTCHAFVPPPVLV